MFVFYQIKLLDSDMRITNWSYKSSDLLNESFYPNDDIQQISLRYVRKGVPGEWWDTGLGRMCPAVLMGLNLQGRLYCGMH